MTGRQTRAGSGKLGGKGKEGGIKIFITKQRENKLLERSMGRSNKTLPEDEEQREGEERF